MWALASPHSNLPKSPLAHSELLFFLAFICHYPYLLKVICKNPTCSCSVFLNWNISLLSSPCFQFSFLTLNKVVYTCWLNLSTRASCLLDPPLTPVTDTHVDLRPSLQLCCFQNHFCQSSSDKKIQRSSNQITILPAANLHINNAPSNFCHHCHSNNKVISADLAKDWK